MSQSELNKVVVNNSKRQFLQGLSVLMGGAVVTQWLDESVLGKALAYTSRPDSASKAGELFNQPQMKMLHDICAIVIPKTETLGAAEVDVHGFIDSQLNHIFSKDVQHQAIQLLETINKVAKARYKLFFNDLTQAQQTTLLTDLDGFKGNGFQSADSQQFRFLKSLIAFGYYTSEVGATQELKYLAVPGGFRAVPYAQVGSAWGSRDYY